MALNSFQVLISHLCIFFDDVSLAHFLSGAAFSLWSFESSLRILDTVLWQIGGWQIFSPHLWLVFPFSEQCRSQSSTPPRSTAFSLLLLCLQYLANVCIVGTPQMFVEWMKSWRSGRAELSGPWGGDYVLLPSELLAPCYGFWFSSDLPSSILASLVSWVPERPPRNNEHE